MYNIYCAHTCSQALTHTQIHTHLTCLRTFTHTQSVDYRGISRSRKFEAYVRATAELKRVELTNMSRWVLYTYKLKFSAGKVYMLEYELTVLPPPRDEKIAFFINIYNALVVHAFVVQGPPSTLWKRFRVCAKLEQLSLGSVSWALLPRLSVRLHVHIYVHVHTHTHTVLQPGELHHWWPCVLSQ